VSPYLHLKTQTNYVSKSCVFQEWRLLGCYVVFLHSHLRENLKSYIVFSSSLEFRTMDEVLKSRDSECYFCVILSVNPLKYEHLPNPRQRQRADPFFRHRGGPYATMTITIHFGRKKLDMIGGGGGRGRTGRRQLQS
jgi:hypothetical protein